MVKPLENAKSVATNPNGVECEKAKLKIKRLQQIARPRLNRITIVELQKNKKC
jgi:hypothetical protein